MPDTIGEGKVAAGTTMTDQGSVRASTTRLDRRGSGLHPLALIACYIVLALFPLVLSALQPLPARNFWRELSSGLVMVGFAMLLAQFLLSGRFRQLSGRVGIDLTMRFHQLAAITVLAFIVAHPILYAVPRLAESPGAALATLQRMFLSSGLRSGVIAWWLLILLVPLAIWRDRLPGSYEIWRLSHGVGAAIIAGLSAHHTLRVGTYSSDAWLAAFWILLAGLALASLAHVYLIKPLLQLSSPWRVAGNRKVADRTWEVMIEPKDGHAIEFDAGQFVWLNLGHSPFSLIEHPFSISSAPAARPRLAFTIKENGDFTNRIGTIPVGTTAYLDGPHGTFVWRGSDVKHLVLIAGGVGFAPVIGILRQLVHDHYPYPVHLIYGNRVETQILYRDEVEAMTSKLDLRLDLVLSEPPPGWPGRAGELTPEVLRACLPSAPAGALYFVCGPVAMMDTVETTLIGMGAPEGRIVSERFKYD
jgi:predicted ferric reductase